MAKEKDESKGEEKKAPKPTIGRVVHYQLGPDEVRAATVAKVNDAKSGNVNLNVAKGESGEFVGQSNVIAGNGAAFPTALLGGVAYDEGGAPGTWHWPQRE